MAARGAGVHRTPAEMQDLRNSCGEGTCRRCASLYTVCLYQVVVYTRGITITQKQNSNFTLILSFLHETIFLKLHTLFCRHISLKSCTKGKRLSLSRTEPFTYVIPVELLQAVCAASPMGCLIEDADVTVKQYLFIAPSLC